MVHVLRKKYCERLVTDLSFMKWGVEGRVYENNCIYCMPKKVFNNYHSISFGLCFKLSLPKFSAIKVKSRQQRWVAMWKSWARRSKLYFIVYVWGPDPRKRDLLKKIGVEEWNDSSKMKRLIILKIKFEGKEVTLREGDGGKVSTAKEFYHKMS